MDTIPIYSVTAFSGSGKTTYLEALIPALKGLGLRVAVIKHDGHDFEIDRPGKDSWRFSNAGADVTAVVSQTKVAFLENRTLSPEEAADRIRHVDLIITEGYKHGPWPKIGLLRSASGSGLPLPLECFCAIVADTPVDAPCPVFPLDQPELLARWLAQKVSHAAGTS